ncbi:MAG: type II toxin-antitoxin system VapC family toxin [Acidimicrobiales bacterium]
MALYLDPSALVRRYVHALGHDLVLATMAGATEWCTSSLTLSECQLALRQMTMSSAQFDRLNASLQRDWAACWVIPIDDRCLARAAQLGAQFGLRTVDALHIAAADRLPRPAALLTFDRHQIPAATALNFEVISPLA